MNRSVDFFEAQFRDQAARRDYALNPFERAILSFLSGDVLELGCGLGNLSMAAAGAGSSVTALDASPTGVADLSRRAAQAGLRVEARVEDLRRYRATRQYDCVVSVGLLMFFSCAEAAAVLAQSSASVRPGGIAAFNVLIEGTTYMAMFDPAAHCLFRSGGLQEAFAGWTPLLSSYEDFAAPGETLKRFHTLIARRPAGPA